MLSLDVSQALYRKQHSDIINKGITLVTPLSLAIKPNYTLVTKFVTGKPHSTIAPNSVTNVIKLVSFNVITTHCISL